MSDNVPPSEYPTTAPESATLALCKRKRNSDTADESEDEHESDYSDSFNYIESYWLSRINLIGENDLVDRSKRVARAILFCILFDWVFHNPYCGILFRCGCTFNWSGGYENCNVHNTNGLPKCPWCNVHHSSLSFLAPFITDKCTVIVMLLTWWWTTANSAANANSTTVVASTRTTTTTTTLLASSSSSVIFFPANQNNNNNNDAESEILLRPLHHHDEDDEDDEDDDDDEVEELALLASRTKFPSSSRITIRMFPPLGAAVGLMSAILAFLSWGFLWGIIFFLGTDYPCFLWWYGRLDDNNICIG